MVATNQVVEAASQRNRQNRIRAKEAEGDRTLVAGSRIPGVVLQILAEADRIQEVAILEGHNRRGRNRQGHNRPDRSRVVRVRGMAEADRRIGGARHRTARAGTSVPPTGAICISTTSGFWRT